MTRRAAGRPVAALLAAIVAACGGGTDPSRLDVGDCFDLPNQTDRIGDIRARPCGEPHGGEVFHVFDAAPASAAYPTDREWEAIVYPICDPVFETYTGTPIGSRTDIDYRYLVPTADRWPSGDRRVTCFIVPIDGAPLTRSFRDS